MYTIDSEKCDGCKKCMDICDFGAIYLVDEKARIESSLCTECGLCVDVCPQNAIIVSGYEIQKAASNELSAQKSFLTLVKSGLAVMGSALLPVLMSKVSDFIVEKIEESGTRSLAPKKGEHLSHWQGKRLRKRMRRNLHK